MAEMGTEQEAPATTGQEAEKEAATPTAAEGQAETLATEQEATDDEVKQAEIKAAEKKDQTDPGVKREIGKLRRELREMREKNARQEGFIEGLKTAGKPDSTSTAAKADEYHIPRPTQLENEAYEDYTIRLSDWNYERRDWMKEQQGKTAKVSAEQQAIVGKATTQHEAGLAKYEDFDDVVRDLPNLPNAIIEELYDSEVGHDMAYFFGQNPKELDKILALPMNKAMKEIARLEDRMKAGTVVNTKTNAPEPPPTVRAGGSAGNDALYMSDKLSAAERIRMSQDRKRQAAGGR
jgi:hypothetical protein